MTGEERCYDQGGYLPGGLVEVRNDTGAPIPVYTAVQLSRGSVVMSRASIDALGEDVLRRMAGGDVEVIAAEDALAELDADEQRCEEQ